MEWNNSIKIINGLVKSILKTCSKDSLWIKFIKQRTDYINIPTENDYCDSLKWCLKWPWRGRWYSS